MSAEVFTAALDRAEGAVWIVLGFYSDRSGAKLFGVYSSQVAAQDRYDLLNAADTPYQVRLVKMIANKADPQEVF